ncbi:ComEC/Rec2 family competence protein [Roseospirillum parvum]|uniref:Competence protein ComEC n=1 Tax=Roseospirillum parvum TaxID=83401 RepID=A0A1G7U9A4_9PROT|nr:ComEC/Rec2 family competence protein [Roseospirillum parvum]SDG43968.1 competence protein ComEC [Roseospirillum parvum]
MGRTTPAGRASPPPRWGLRRASPPPRWGLWLPVALGAGVGLYFALPREPSAGLCLGLLAGAMVLAGLALTTGRRLGGGLPVAALLLLAAVLGLGAGTVRSAWVAAPVIDQRLGPLPVAGRVVDVEPKGARHRVTLDRLSLPDLDPEATPRRLRLTVAGSPPEPGRRIELDAVVLPPPPPAAPGGFDFPRRAWFQGLGGVGYAVGPWRLLPLTEPPGVGAALALTLADLRQTVARRIARALPEAALFPRLDDQPGAVAVALLTGHRGGVDEATWQAFRDAGVAHLLAISGLHMTLVAGLAFVALRRGLAAVPALAGRLDLKKPTAAAALLVAGLYLLLAGAPISAQRAFVMIALVLGAVLADRTALSLNGVAWAAGLILLVQPEALVSPAFQMSFAAVTALVAVYEGAARPLRQRVLGERPTWPRHLALYIAGVALTTLVAGAATAPFAAFHFNRLAAYGLLGNLLAVPWMGLWVMPFGLLALLLMPLGLEHLALVPMGLGLEVMMAAARWVAGLPGAAARVPDVPAWGLLAAVAGGLLLCLVRGRRRWLGLPLLAGALAAPWLGPPPDLLIGPQGRVIALGDGQGGYLTTPGRADSWTRAQWAARFGPARGDLAPGVRQGAVRCGPEGCLRPGPDGRLASGVALPFTARAAVEDCGRVAVLVLTNGLPRPPLCPDTRIIDRASLKAGGAHAVWLAADAPRLRQARPPGTARPWHARPSSR